MLLGHIKARLKANHLGRKWHVFFTMNKCSACSELLHFVNNNHRCTRILYVENAELYNVIASHVIAFTNRVFQCNVSRNFLVRVPLLVSKNNHESGILAHVSTGCPEDRCQKFLSQN